MTVPARFGALAGVPLVDRLQLVTREWFRYLTRAIDLATDTAMPQVLQVVSPNLSIANNTTPQALAPCSFAIGANEQWSATFTLDVGDNITTTGVQVQLTYPAGGRADINVDVIVDSGFAPSMLEVSNASSPQGFSFAFAGGPFKGKVNILAFIKNGTAAGTVTLNVAQGISSATALIFREGSRMMANRFA